MGGGGRSRSKNDDFLETKYKRENIHRCLIVTCTNFRKNRRENTKILLSRLFPMSHTGRGGGVGHSRSKTLHFRRKNVVLETKVQKRKYLP